MTQHSISPSQFVEPVDPFIEDDILELQPQDALDVVIVDDFDDDTMAVPASERKRGRSANDIWNLFTDDVDPQGSIRRIAMFDLGKSHGDVTEAEWVAWFMDAHDEEPAELDALKRHLQIAVQFDTRILDADSRVS
ncbi:hypothetical protein DYB32_010788 [Aphanomyces invadans]|uniref:Uncharacterized protein n=1 Tax=Aphanomyces invadans TaxID=157072 RepID=A0A3R6YVV7_9STRA|nr:hypothetical protein DYB32_010788 [Aphanomyces invadans]